MSDENTKEMIRVLLRLVEMANRKVTTSETHDIAREARKALAAVGVES